jgi:hypothetical protein
MQLQVIEGGRAWLLPISAIEIVVLSIISTMYIWWLVVFPIILYGGQNIQNFSQLLSSSEMVHNLFVPFVEVKIILVIELINLLSIRIGLDDFTGVWRTIEQVLANTYNIRPPNFISVLFCPAWMGNIHEMFNNMRFQERAVRLYQYAFAAVSTYINTQQYIRYHILLL